MKILIINPIMYTCESNNIRKVASLKDTLMYNVCMGFLKNGDEPTLIAASDFKPQKKETYPFEILYFDTILKKILPPRFLPLMKGLNLYLKKNINNFDYVICSESFSLSTLAAVITFKERCFVWQEMAKHQKKFYKLPSKIWHNIVIKNFYKKSLIVPRSLEAKKFISSYSKNVSNIIVEHGMNLDKFPCEKNNVENQFIVVSQLVERKQIDKIIKYFSNFIKKYNLKFRLVICGDGTEKIKLMDLAAKLDLTSEVTFMGQCNHELISNMLSKSKAMLIYTKKDNNMVSIIEAIASGTPVLTTSIPYNSAYIKEFDLGIVNDNWNEDDLYKLNLDFKKYSNNCVKYRDNLSSRHTAEEFNKIYLNYIERKVL